MSERLARLRAHRREVWERANAIVQPATAANRALTDDEHRAFTDLTGQLDGLDSAIGQIVEQANRAEEADKAMALLAGGQPQLHDGVPPLLPDPVMAAEMFRSLQRGETRRWSLDDEETRAAVTLALTGTPASAGLTRSGQEPRRLSAAAGLSTRRVDGSENVVFPVFGAGTAATAAEGATKAEYAAITAGTAAPQMISNWTDYTRQVALSQLNFESRLRNQLAVNVAVAEDSLLVSKVLATSGIASFAKTAGVPASDALLQAAATVLGGPTSAEPNLAVVNPTDVVKVFTGSSGQSGESPEEQLRLKVRGMKIYVTSAITSGTALVGAWPQSSEFVVGLPPTYLVDAVSQIKSNKITLLLEEAVDLAVDQPLGFCKITGFIG